MARQKGPLLLEGTIGGIIFYKNKHGYLVRGRGGVSAQRIATEARFARTRENATEFGRASRAGKLLRLGIQACCPGAEDAKTNVRLAARLMKIVQSDAVNGRGLRQVMPDTVQQLEGFQWRESSLPGLMQAIGIDPGRGIAACRIPEWTATRDMGLPAGATHFVLTLAVVRVDVAGNAQVNSHVDSQEIAVASRHGRALELECALPAGGGNILVAGIGLRALQEVNGRFVELKECAGFRVGKAVAG